MLKCLPSYRFTSSSNTAASPLLQAWTRSMSSYPSLCRRVRCRITNRASCSHHHFPLPREEACCSSLRQALGGERLHNHRCSAVVAVHWPRFLLILWTSNVGSPEESLAFVPSSSTRSPGFRDLFCLLVRV